MADRIEQFPAQQRPPARRYPWNEWTDGSAWRLVRGEDFDQPIDDFRNRLYPQAKKRRLKVRSAKRVEDAHGTEPLEVLVIEFYDPDKLGGAVVPAKGNSTAAEEPALLAS